jgi:hypothetical protein
VQAVGARIGRNGDFYTGPQFDEQSQEYSFIREVIDGCKQILQMVIELSADGKLKYIPVRIYVRIASASIYLIHVRVLFLLDQPPSCATNILIPLSFIIGYRSWRASRSTGGVSPAVGTKYTGTPL